MYYYSYYINYAVKIDELKQFLNFLNFLFFPCGQYGKVAVIHVKYGNKIIVRQMELLHFWIDTFWETACLAAQQLHRILWMTVKVIVRIFVDFWRCYFDVSIG